MMQQIVPLTELPSEALAAWQTWSAEVAKAFALGGYGALNDRSVIGPLGDRVIASGFQPNKQRAMGAWGLERAAPMAIESAMRRSCRP